MLRVDSDGEKEWIMMLSSNHVLDAIRNIN